MGNSSDSPTVSGRGERFRLSGSFEFEVVDPAAVEAFNRALGADDPTVAGLAVNRVMIDALRAAQGVTGVRWVSGGLWSDS